MFNEDMALIELLLGAVWLVLMLRAAMAEYQYYQSVKQFEPVIWQQLGAPAWFKIPMVFVSGEGNRLLKQVTHDKVRSLAVKHRQTGLQFITYVVIVLVSATVFFKFA